jgi:nitrate reductase delta subunit
MLEARRCEICGALSALLAYPRGDLAGPAGRAAELARGTAAAEPLARFGARALAGDLPAIQELYTATFDLQPACTPYVGHHLVGDSPMRGPLLARLVEVYALGGYRAREELPDHLCEVLGYLSVAPPGPLRDDLVRDGLLPALGRMIEELPDPANPYRDLLVAARELLSPAAAGRPRPEVRP